MSETIEIKPGMKIKIKELGVCGKMVVEKTIAEGVINAIRPFPDDLDEAGEIDLNIKGTVRTFLVTSETRIEVV